MAVSDPQVKFVLGPTNTGKTYYAVDRMMAYSSGMAGFPLRLLARENYDKMVARLGASRVALITGEEKIIPAHANYFCCTVEAMPLSRDVDCLIVDEIQLCGDKERGHVFTDRLLHARGRHETLFLGADTMRPILQQLFPDAEFIYRERLSRLSYAGHKKASRLPRRSALVAFSAAEVYRLAELVRRQRGGTAVVMGALSPRTRNAQVELFQNGDVDFMIATDAIGMGLNMDIGHVALADDIKFDGRSVRHLMPAEIAQIAGRAGRHTTDGTFGTTEGCRAFEQELIDAVEGHRFAPVRGLYWRNRTLNFKTLDGLLQSLEAAPPHPVMMKKADGDDHLTLAALADMQAVRALADNPGRLRLLWDVVQIPDFRQSMTDSHVVMLTRIFTELARDGQLKKDWVASQLQHLDRLDGDIDTLMTRIAHIRTWTYITHKTGWTDSTEGWPELARAIEDRLSDELHTRLTQRFVDRRAAHLSRRLKESATLLASVRLDGSVLVEGEEVGSLHGFSFVPSLAESEEKAVILAAARKGLPDEIERRVGALTISADPAFKLDRRGQIFWREAIIARLVKSDCLYAPRVEVGDSDLLSHDQKARIQDRLNQFITDHVVELLQPLVLLTRPEKLFAVEPAAGQDMPETMDSARAPSGPEAGSEDSAEPPLQDIAQDTASQKPVALSGAAKGLLYQLYEGLGTVPRRLLADQIKELSETDKPLLARAGIRMGIENLFLPAMLKPAPIALRIVLYSLYHQNFPVCGAPPEGRVSFSLGEGDGEMPEDGYWLAAGYCRLGTRIMRVDMIERVAALVRAAAREGQFEISDDMLSLAGVGREEMGRILSDLGCKQVSERASEDPEKPAIAIFERQKRKSMKSPRPDKARSHKGAAKGAGRAPSRGKPPAASRPRGQSRQNNERAPDPNSPFAVLAALKKG
ncbi:MAG: helicase-related protein [Candidatus Puniceispirillaceae bacterium]